MRRAALKAAALHLHLNTAISTGPYAGAVRRGAEAPL